MSFSDLVFWVYIVLLLLGGLFGFYKGKSKISLITSAVSAALLVLTALPGMFRAVPSRGIGERHHGRAAGGVCHPAGEDEEIHARAA